MVAWYCFITLQYTFEGMSVGACYQLQQFNKLEDNLIWLKFQKQQQRKIWVDVRAVKVRKAS